MKMADHLAAKLHDAAIGETSLFHPTACTTAGFENDDIGAAVRQVAGGAETGQAGTEHNDVIPHAAAWTSSGSRPRRASSRPASSSEVPMMSTISPCTARSATSGGET